MLLGVLLAMAALAVSAYVRRLLGATPLWGLVHLFIVPVVLEVPAYLRDLACRQADDEAFERLGNPHLFLQAVQIALEESYRCGETHKQLQRMLKRLNRLRARLGEPPLTSQEVKRRVGKPEQQQEESMSAANTVAEEE